MPTQQLDRREERAISASVDPATRAISNESLILRNYDDDSAHDLHVRFVDHEGAVAFDRTVSVAPRETVSIQTRLERAVYRVTVRMETGATARADCLLGSDPSECAMVETGNGLVSVVEGVF
jgi:hypothetical protein